MALELFKIFGTLGLKGVKEAKSELSDVTGSANKSSGRIGSAMKKIGLAVAGAFAIDKIKDFGMGCIQAAADMNAMNSQFSQVFGDLEGQAAKSLSGIAKEAGISENRMKGSFTKIAAFAKTTGMDTESALGLSERAMVAVADSAAFYDRSLEETTESLQSFLKGNYENDAALGLSCTETTRNAAANELYGKSFKDLSESQKQLTLLKMVEDANELSGALGQAARESDTWTNVTGNLKQAWTDLQAKLGAPILGLVTKAVSGLATKLTNLTNKISSGTNPVQLFVDKLGSLKDWMLEIGGYAADTLQPIFTDIETVFTKVKDAIEPLVESIVEYVTSGQAASDITTVVKGAVDLLASAYESVKGFIEGVVTGFQDAVTWGKEHETTLTLIGIAVGTLTAAIGAYNIAMAIKNAGGIVELAQLATTAISVGALTVAQTAQTVATTIGTAAMSAFGAVMSFVTSPITLVVVAIGALIAIGVLLYKNWDKVTEFCGNMWDRLVEIWENIKTTVGEAVSSVVSAISEKFQAAKDKAVEIFTSIKDALSTAWDAIVNVVKIALGLIGSIISAAVQIITLPFMFIWENCKQYVFAAWEWIKQKVSAAITAVKTTITNVMNAIANFLKPILDGIKSTFSTVWNAIKSTTSTVFNAIKAFFTSVWNGIKSVVSSVVNSIKSAVSTAWNGIKTATSAAFNAVKSTASSVWNGIKSTVSNVANGIKTAVSNVWNGIKTTTSNAFNAVKSTASNVWNGVKTAIKGPIEGARDLVKNAIDKIKGFFNFKFTWPKLKMPHFGISPKGWKVGDLLKGSIPKLSIDWYAKAMQNAMILDKPTIFGYNAATGELMGGGENGSEVVSGTGTLMQMIASAVESRTGAQTQAIVSALAGLTDAILGGNSEMLEALRAGQQIVLNGREVARTVREYA